MTVLITGGTGFVGLALAESLTSSGVACALFGRDPVPKRFSKAPWLKDVPVVLGDITDPEAIANALATPGLSAIVHLAAVTPDSEQEKFDPARIVAVNVGGTAELLRQARRSGNLRIVMSSSVAVYGDVAIDAGPIDENRAPAPLSLYGITKLAAEQLALRLADLYGLDLSIVRLGPLYGPWEWATGVRPLQSPQAQVLELVGRGEPVHLPRPIAGDWIYSRAAAAGIAAIVAAPRLPHRIYNLGGGEVSTIEDWCATLHQAGAAISCDVAAQSGEENVHISLPRDRAPLSVARLAADTGFSPRRRLADCVTDHLSWLATYDRAVPTEEAANHGR